MADSGNWRALQDIVTKRFPGARITSTYRPGSTGSRGTADYHSSGNAVDIGSPNMAMFNWLVENYGDSAEIIYGPAGARQIKNGKPFQYSAAVSNEHRDHIHWARTGAIAEGSVGASATATASGAFDGVTNALNGIGKSLGEVSALADSVNKLALPQWWVRILAGIAGTALVFFGLWKLVGEVRT